MVFTISNNLTRQEAETFAQTPRSDEQYFLVKVFENPNEIHRSKREKFVVVRYPRDGEKICGGYKKIVKKLN